MWVFNVWLYLVFVFSPGQYAGLVEAGASCYAWVPETPGQVAVGEAPTCWYQAPVGREMRESRGVHARAGGLR